jgi:protein SCO1
MTRPRGGRPGVALIALIAIAAITTAWWALALWPVGAMEPEWLSRTRAACFGAAPGGLPDAGGWILLIGEPVGMVGVLVAIWGQSLKSDLQRLRADPVWRLLASSLAIAMIVAFGVLVERVTRAYGWGSAAGMPVAGLRTRLDVDAPGIELIDQYARRVSFADFRGQPVLLTFAFGHCTTVCPTIVRDILAARRAADRSDVRLVVVTLDPWRDTPDRLQYLATHWALAPGDRVLSGSVTEVEAVLATLGIGRARNETTGDVEHGATVMFLDKRGKIAWRLDGAWTDVGDLLLRR